jgi:hypothetical protein
LTSNWLVDVLVVLTSTLSMRALELAGDAGDLALDVGVVGAFEKRP